MTKKYALITGSSRGIGKATALQLAKDGFQLLLHYNKNKQSAEQIKQQTEKFGISTVLFQGDFDLNEGISNFTGAVISWLESQDVSLHTIVNNAGYSSSNGFGEVDFSEFDSLINANVKAPYFLIQSLIPFIQENGRIINISSGVTRIASPQMALYSMSKGAINTMTFTLAKELGEKSITVNTIMPGIIDTESNAGWLHTEGGQAMVQNKDMIALQRAGQTSEIAASVSFLASEKSSYITGHNLDVTGGGQL